MRGTQYVEDREPDLGGPPRRQRAVLAYGFGEGLALDELHDDPRAVVLVDDVVDRHRAVVADPGDRLGLAQRTRDEPALLFLVDAVGEAEFLHGDGTAEGLVDGPPDGAHAAAPEHAAEPVPPGEQPPVGLPPGTPPGRARLDGAAARTRVRRALRPWARCPGSPVSAPAPDSRTRSRPCPGAVGLAAPPRAVPGAARSSPAGPAPPPRHGTPAPPSRRPARSLAGFSACSAVSASAPDPARPPTAGPPWTPRLRLELLSEPGPGSRLSAASLPAPARNSCDVLLGSGAPRPCPAGAPATAPPPTCVPSAIPDLRPRLPLPARCGNPPWQSPHCPLLRDRRFSRVRTSARTGPGVGPPTMPLLG